MPVQNSKCPEGLCVVNTAHNTCIHCGQPYVASHVLKLSDKMRVIDISPNAPPVQEIHMFDSTGEAYDATQTELANGDIVHVPREKVLGLSTTWPLAVTAEVGQLHGVKDGADVSAVLARARITREQVARAVREAKLHGYQIAQWAEEFA